MMAEGGRGAFSDDRQVGNGGTSNTVEVRGFSANINKELLEMYFENSRRSGGGDTEEVQIGDGVAYITFMEAEVAQRVVSRSNHQVDGQSLTVALFHPSPPKPCYENRVLIQGLTNAITEKMLTNFLETVTEAKVREFLYGEEEGKVVVTLSDNIDIAQLRKIFRERSIERAFLQVTRVDISNCIIVQNIQSSTSHDVVLYYFENKRRSGGGDVGRVEMKADEGYCLVYFEDPSVIDRVLSQSHKVDGADVEVYLHHECLGLKSSRNRFDPYLRISCLGQTVSAILEEEHKDNQAKDKTSSSVSSNPEKESDFVEVPEWQENDGKNCTLSLWIKYKRASDMKIVKCIKNLPCNWNFHVYWNFYTKTKQGQQMLYEIVNKYSCSVTVFTEDEDLFIFEVSKKSFEHESDVVCYIHVVLDDVYKCALQFLYFDTLLVDQRIQGDVFQLVRQRKESDSARIELMGQQDNDAMCVICTEKDKTSVLHVVTEIIQSVKECFENHEETISVDHTWQKVMKQFGYIQKLCDKYPELTIILDEAKPAILLKGARDQSKAAADHLMELVRTAQSEVKEDIFSPGCQFDIFTYPEMCDYIDNIILELSIVWIPNQLTKKIHLFSKKLDKIKSIDKTIKGCVQERLYPLQRGQSVHSPLLSSSLAELKKKYVGKIVINPSPTGLRVTTADDIFESVDVVLQEMISEQTDLTTCRVNEKSMAGRIRTSAAVTGLLPKTSNEYMNPAGTKCIENSEEEINQEPMEEIQSEKSINENDTEKNSLSSLSASVDERKNPEDELSYIKIKSVEKISQARYQIFKYFFTDLSVQVHFSEEEGCIYVKRERQESADRITADIQNAFSEMAKFQESVVNITREKYEHAKQLLEEMNNSSPERKVYCYIFDPCNIRIVARTMDEAQAAKHKMNFKLGNIRIKDHHKKSSTHNDSKDHKESSSVSSERPYTDNTRRSFTTAEGIRVFVYRCSILKAKVDVIVNAANEDLRHDSGVAKVIADAAGRELLEECKRYIMENGRLNVGSSCITSGGNLKHHFVIHTVEPQWDKYNKTPEGVQKCMDDLWKAVIGCFFKAETLQVQSIALTAVSSGMYGVPMEICASQYLSAVLKYSKSMNNIGSLKEIHFIDENDAVLDLITLAFSASLEDNKAASEQFSHRLKNVISTFEPSSVSRKFGSIQFWNKGGHISENVAPLYKVGKKKSEFIFSKILKVLIYIGDITESKCKAIVSSEAKTFKSQGGVAKATRTKAGQKFDACIAWSYRGQLREIGDLVEVDAGNLKCEKVICCVVPMWNNRISDEDYRKKLEHCFKSIMEKAKSHKSIAIPLIGSGFKDSSIEICGKVLLDCLLKFSVAHREKETIREVHIVSLEDESIAYVRSIFMDYFEEQKKLNAEREQPGFMLQGGFATVSDRNNPPPPEATEDMTSCNLWSNQPPEAQKMDRGKDNTQNNCVICIYPFKNPVKMRKCNHVFCKDCIDTQLQYKPVCPTCNTIYGVVTGDQPAGKMTEYINRRIYLEGYEECGTIEITYDIPDGFQSDVHLRPGKPYQGLKKTAYLPYNDKGQKVLRLLHFAFERRLIFTIVQSTSKKYDMVTWNDIHHKTRKYGGPER